MGTKGTIAVTLTGVAVGHGADDRPADGLEEVVGAGDEVEAVAVRNGALAGSGGTQVAQRQVCVKVGYLSKLCPAVRGMLENDVKGITYSPDTCKGPQPVGIFAVGTNDGGGLGGEFRRVDLVCEEEAA